MSLAIHAYVISSNNKTQDINSLLHTIAPPTNQSSYHQWTIGAVFYSALVVAEAFGSSNTSQIIDLQGNDGNIYTPQYAIYENGALAKVALFNYVTDPTGATDYTVTLSVGGGTTGVASAMPASVKVK